MPDAAAFEIERCRRLGKNVASITVGAQIVTRQEFASPGDVASGERAGHGTWAWVGFCMAPVLEAKNNLRKRETASRQLM